MTCKVYYTGVTQLKLQKNKYVRDKNMLAVTGMSIYFCYFSCVTPV